MISWEVKFEISCANSLLMNYFIASSGGLSKVIQINRTEPALEMVLTSKAHRKQQDIRTSHRESNPSLQKPDSRNRQAQYPGLQKRFLKGGTLRSNHSLSAEHSADATCIIYQHSIDIYQTTSINQVLTDKLVEETSSCLPLLERQWDGLLDHWSRISGGRCKPAGTGEEQWGLVRSSQVG